MISRKRGRQRSWTALLEKPEISVVGAPAIAAILLSLADLFNLIDEGSPLARHVPVLTLLLLGILLTHHAFDLSRMLRKVDAGIGDLQKRDFSQLHMQLDSEMRKVFGEYVTEMIENVNCAVEERKMTITDMDLFRYFYRQTLDAYPKRTFLATSIPSGEYFWQHDSTEAAIANFIRSRGKMKRIFWVEFKGSESMCPASLSDEETKIIRTHVEMGVEVYATIASAVPRAFNCFFFTESTGLIAWEAQLAEASRMKIITACSSQEANMRYAWIFEQLLTLDTTYRVLCHPNDPAKLIFESQVRELPTSRRRRARPDK